MTLDPLRRWTASGVVGKPQHAGLLTYAGLEYTEDVAELADVDVAILGAPTDDLLSSRPGTRYGPRAIRDASGDPGMHVGRRVDWWEQLRVVDYGDAPVVPADPLRTADAIERLVGEVLGAGTIPITLGGDHSIVYPELKACAAVHGPLALVHFDAHTDTGAEIYGVEVSHGTPMYRLVEDGHVVGERYVQLGLRGYWPGPPEWAWQERHGVTALPMTTIDEIGLDAAIERAVAVVGDHKVFLTVDVDVLDPAFAPGTGTMEPGGMTSRELLKAVGAIARALDVVAADVV